MKTSLFLTAAISAVTLCGVAYADIVPGASTDPYGLVNREGEATPTAISMFSPEAYGPTSWGNIPSMGSIVLSQKSPRRAEGGTENSDDEYVPEIYGVVSAYTNVAGGGFQGLARVPMKEGEAFTRITTGGATGIPGAQVSSGTESDGKFYTNVAVSRYGSLYCTYHYIYNSDTWQRLAYAQSTAFPYVARDMATDPTTGKMYGVFMKTDAGTTFTLAEYEAEYTSSAITHTRHAICDLPNMFTALFFTADGQLWGIDMITETTTDDAGTSTTDTKSASLYKIDKVTGELTLIGDTGAKPYYVSSACCDVYGNGKVYWAVKTLDLTGSLYTVDTTTGKATKLFDFPNKEEVVAMFVKSRPSEAAPAAPANLRFVTENGALSGTIEFDAPTTLANGDPATGELSYSVTLNNSDYASGTTTYGGKVSIPFSLTYGGNTTVTARVFNEAGGSETVNYSEYLGNGTPAVPQNVTATYEDGHITVKWDKVTGAVGDYGYIDSSSIRYKVVRSSDGEVLVTDYDKTTYVDANIVKDGSLGYYRYSVYATCASGTTSGEGKSAAIVYGNIIPPFKETFDDVYRIDSTTDDGIYGLYRNVKITGGSSTHWYVHSSTKAACIFASTTVEENFWLETPGVKLEAGKNYTISMYTWAGTANKQLNLAVAMSSSSSVSSDENKKMLIERTPITVTSTSKKYLYADFTVEESGIYYFGLEHYSDNQKNGGFLYVDDLTIQETQPKGRPNSVTSFKVTVPTYGDFDANISFTTPTTGIEGDALEGTMDVYLTRNGEIIKTWKDTAAGTAITYTDTYEEVGDHTYAAYCTNSAGTSDAVSASAHLGNYAPKPVSAVTLTDNGDGTLTVGWTAVLKDSKNKAITSDALSFCIVAPSSDGSTIIVKDDIPGTETSYTFTAYDPNGSQGLVQLGVAQKTNGGYSSVVATSYLPVGKAYTAPFVESFNGTSNHVIYATSTSTTVAWSMLTDSDLPGVTAADGDNAYLAMYSQYYGGTGYVATGRIDLTGVEHPGLSFRVYNLDGGSSNLNEITVKITADGTTSSLKATADQIGGLGYANEWVKYVVKLDQYIGKIITVEIDFANKTYQWNFIDNLLIGEIPLNDVSIIAHSGSEAIEETESAAFSASFVNNGYNDAKFNARLYMNGEPVASEELSLANANFGTVSFTHRPDVDKGTVATYVIKADFDGENDDTDNASDAMEVEVMQPAYPTVNTLVAKSSDNINYLAWQAPDLNYMPNPYTESFEDSEAWTGAIKNWTSLDVDTLAISLGTANGNWPDIATGDKRGFFVFDVNDMTTQQQASIYYQAHKGTKYIGKAAPSDRSAFGDDWAISPELNGCAQTISLQARSESNLCLENIEILYSTGSVNPADFVSVGKYIDVPQAWTEYTANLPEGAKRLAVRAYSAGTFFLHVDDVKYIPTPLNLEIAGYHIWRDGARLTTEPVTGTEYQDVKGDSDATSHTYRVSVVYTVGESCPSNEVSCEFTGLEGLDQNGGISIMARQNSVVVTGANGLDINVYAVDGRLIASEEGSDMTTIDLNSGVYVVKAGNTVAKVVVR